MCVCLLLDSVWTVKHTLLKNDKRIGCYAEASEGKTDYGQQTGVVRSIEAAQNFYSAKLTI